MTILLMLIISLTLKNCYVELHNIPLFKNPHCYFFVYIPHTYKMSGDYAGGLRHAQGQMNSTSQPNAKFWHNMYDSNAPSMELNMHQGENRDGYYNLLFMNHPGQTTAGGWVGANDIDSLWIPPNWQMRADACGNTNHCNSNQHVANYDGAGGNAGFSGLYWPISDAIGQNNIDTIHLTQKQDIDETDLEGKRQVSYTWPRVLQKCCTGKLNNCGSNFNGPSAPGCAAQFNPCTGADLVRYDSANRSYQQLYCTSKCKADMQGCDIDKKKYCNALPASPWCACINLPQTPKYKEWLASFTKRFPSIVASPLMYADAEGKNPCRDNISGDLNDIFIPYELTLSIGNLPESYTITELNVNVLGDNNILTDIDMSQNINVGGANQNAPNQNAPNPSIYNSNIPDSNLINQESDDQIFGLSDTVIFLILLGIIIAILFAGVLGFYIYYQDKEEVDPNTLNDQNTDN